MPKARSEPTEKQKAKKGFSARWTSNESSFCCGIMEIGQLWCEEGSEWYQVDDWVNWNKCVGVWKQRKVYDSPTAAWTAALHDIRNNQILDCEDEDNVLEPRPFPFMINIVVDDDDRHTNPLRAILQQEKDTKMVHSWVNPNTGNRLEMYLITNGSENNE